MSLNSGNRTSKTVNQVTTTYGWDYENKLVSLHDGATLSFTYCGDGLRQSRTVDGTTTQYAYDGVRLLKELDANGATQTSYTLTPMDGEWYRLISDRSGAASRWFAFDALGTTRALSDQQSAVSASFTDDAWGNVLSATDPGATPHQYVGKLGYYTDAASGLQLLTQRYYDAGVGRFVSEDPVRDGMDWHGYGASSPTTFIDPLGLWHLDFTGQEICLKSDPEDEGHPFRQCWPATSGQPGVPFKQHTGPIRPGDFEVGPVHDFGIIANMLHSSYGGWSQPITPDPEPRDGMYIHAGPTRNTWGCIRVLEQQKEYREKIKSISEENQTIPLHVDYPGGVYQGGVCHEHYTAWVVPPVGGPGTGPIPAYPAQRCRNVACASHPAAAQGPCS